MDLVGEGGYPECILDAAYNVKIWHAWFDHHHIGTCRVRVRVSVTAQSQDLIFILLIESVIILLSNLHSLSLSLHITFLDVHGHLPNSFVAVGGVHLIGLLITSKGATGANCLPEWTVKSRGIPSQSGTINNQRFGFTMWRCDVLDTWRNKP